jgi:hypothetical protein
MKMRYFYIFLSALYMLFQPADSVSVKGSYNPMTCEERLKALKPSEPKTVYAYQIGGPWWYDNALQKPNCCYR